jgi:hypothetical protein
MIQVKKGKDLVSGASKFADKLRIPLKIGIYRGINIPGPSQS